MDTDNLQFTFYGGDSFWIFTESVKIHALSEAPDHLNGVGNVEQRPVQVPLI